MYNIFTKDECQRIINTSEKIGFDKLTGYDPRYRNNVRMVIDSTIIINEFEKRVKNYLDKVVKIDKDSDTIIKTKMSEGEWKFHKLNPHLRICRYNDKGRFGKHYDLGYHPDPLSIRTIKTCMIYLNDEFKDGCTRFYKGELDVEKSHEMFYKLKPKTGMCIIFNQHIVHDGEIVKDGLKYIMRTDVFYKAISLKNKPSESEQKALDIYAEADKLEGLGNDLLEKAKLLQYECRYEESDKCKEDATKIIKDAQNLYMKGIYICDYVDKLFYG